MFGRRAERGQVEARPSQVRDEQELIARVASGDLRAFEALYRLYHPRLTRFLGAITRRAHVVEEALNDTMFVVWRRADSYDGRSKVSTWVFAIAYRKAREALRKLDEPLEDAADTRESAEPAPDHQYGQGQLQKALVQAMAGLSADHRAVVDLTYFHEIGYREIAQIMDCPVDTVKTRMFHARRRLRAMLAGDLADWL
ncbi:MAG TPA: sigma-70 family RNA polymerase sigma factor [Caulobacteraceae bacterium]|nr:sigma-70 family RNA polymerase sigma factor [Caulobacteraceae bacterium]